jgi:hypothetical protein
MSLSVKHFCGSKDADSAVNESADTSAAARALLEVARKRSDGQMARLPVKTVPGSQMVRWSYAQICIASATGHIRAENPAFVWSDVLV